MQNNTDSLQITRVEYRAEWFATQMRGDLSEAEALLLILQQLPFDAVGIEDSVRVRTEKRPTRPHPACEAAHTHQPVTWTLINIKAFKRVDKDHREVVAYFGKSQNVVSCVRITN